MNIPFAPTEGSLHAQQYDSLFWSMFGFSLLIVVLVGTLLVVFSIRFRSGSDAPRHQTSTLHRRELEIGWTSATVILALFFFWWTASKGLVEQRLPEDALEVHVEAKQWMWKARHPGGQRELNALHVPAGQPVIVYLNSQDVIHSFYVPAFRVKQDVVPGRTSALWFTPSEPGTYRLMCAEYCGTAHSRMQGDIVVMEPEDYSRWLASRPEGDTLVAEGRALYTDGGVLGLPRAERGGARARRWTGSTGARCRCRTAGWSWPTTPTCTNSILLPKRDVVAGYRADHARFRPHALGRRDRRPRRLHPQPRQPDGRDPMTDFPEARARMSLAASFLGDGHTVRSWLLTTDHKRVAILYFASVTAFFIIGGAAATLMRLELATPAGRPGGRRTPTTGSSRCTASSWSGSSWCRRCRRRWATSSCRWPSARATWRSRS